MNVMSINATETQDASSSSNAEDHGSSFDTEADTISFEIDASEDEATITDILPDDASVALSEAVANTLANNVADTSIEINNNFNNYNNNTTFNNNNINIYNNSNNNNVAFNETIQLQRGLQSSVPTHSIPEVCIKHQDYDSVSKSSTVSHTASSTPTTADVADVIADTLSTVCVSKGARVALPPIHTNIKPAIVTQLSSDPNTASISEDNLSFSVATTTTTDIDVDNIASISPQLSGKRVTHTKLTIYQNIPKPQNNSDARLQHTAHAESINDPIILPPTLTLKPELRFFNWIRWLCVHFKSSGIGEPSVYHALIVIFLEFFAWGLLTMPVISALNQTFPDHTFLMNGLVMGIKGILSFLSAPLVGALSDIWGRKFFLLITVFFTCAPIPLMAINAWWFFAMISISGALAVTFSVVFAYVADVTTVEERSRAYGLVSATFAASLVISPALGALLMETYGDTLVVALATAIAVLDVFFILVAVPESLPEKIRPTSWGAPISWEQADPFSALRKVGSDQTILMQCVTVLLSYLPEAGQYSCIFVYLKLKMGFNSMEVAIFIAVVGTLSISVQVTLGYLMRVLGAKNTIILGLVLEMLQLLWYGLGSQSWMMWAAGILAALGSITYPAISAFVSIHSHPDRQGAVQGMVTGMRGLCNGLGPALFGVIFYLFNVDLNDDLLATKNDDPAKSEFNKYTQLIPGPPFAIGALMVILAIFVAMYIPEKPRETSLSRTASEKKRVSVDVQYEIENGSKSASALSPLMRSDSMAQL